MIKFPIEFEVSAEADSKICNPWKSQTNAFQPIECCIAAEFRGPGNGYTPEDFFALSILNCIIAFCKAKCEKEKESFEKISGKAKLKMDKDPKGKIHFSGIDLTISIKGSSNIKKVKEILEISINNCPVSNSIKTPKTLHLEVK